MKKIIMLFMALCMVLPALNAQNNKALNKALKKEYKVKMKQFKKEKWQIYASSRSLGCIEIVFLQTVAGGDVAHDSCLYVAACLACVCVAGIVDGSLMTDIIYP